MPIELNDETRQALLESIRYYFQEERGEEIGDLQAGLVLDFVVEEIGPSMYNQAIRDAQARLQHVVGELDLNLHEPEFGYWARQRSRSRDR